jgi:hypothetical protein
VFGRRREESFGIIIGKRCQESPFLLPVDGCNASSEDARTVKAIDQSTNRMMGLFSLPKEEPILP